MMMMIPATVSLKDSGEKCFESSRLRFVPFKLWVVLLGIELGNNAAEAIEINFGIFQGGRDLFQVTISKVSMYMDFEGDTQVT